MDARKWLIGGGIGFVLLAGAGAALYTGALKSPFTQAQAKSGDAAALEFAPREVVQPRLAALPRVIEFSGPLVAPQTAVVRAKAAGTLSELAVLEGSRVRAGEVIGRIEIADLASRLAERRANLESARAALDQAQRTFDGNERLVAQQFISKIALDNSRTALETARAGLDAAQAALDTTRAGQRDATLVAPISGIVAKRYALPGEKVSPEQQLVSIVDLAQLELAGNVGTHEVSRLAPGMAAQVRVEGVDEPVAGRIARIAPAAEPGTRSIGVAVALPNPKETLRAGQYGLVRVTLADDRQRLTLPASAIGNNSGQDHVWVIEGGALARRAVTVGRRDAAGGRVEILHGVNAASQVLAARFENLREGAKAVVVAARTPVASAAAPAPALR
ncbi:MAG: efflux RND transporter periplasmic adaptor subunit [Burkholderiales bacterium]|nr:efflux RND transporter periplasmic adaptor subunit [Burkholderiales bacterium]MDE1928524.1 efflux RND transporter periplasmic adaptor subunit [Burkholderiales bacterium]MDE2160510.1 efflux RND transporter periplasmic adaptor subunit [Burkholderiales bacterium]MDE2502342.1 efflux RND transporter periplasmic adaptor subunit [Burkholderiales bacterium]